MGCHGNLLKWTLERPLTTHHPMTSQCDGTSMSPNLPIWANNRLLVILILPRPAVFMPRPKSDFKASQSKVIDVSKIQARCQSADCNEFCISVIPWYFAKFLYSFTHRQNILSQPMCEYLFGEFSWRPYLSPSQLELSIEPHYVKNTLLIQPLHCFCDLMIRYYFLFQTQFLIKNWLDYITLSLYCVEIFVPSSTVQTSVP